MRRFRNIEYNEIKLGTSSNKTESVDHIHRWRNFGVEWAKRKSNIFEHHEMVDKKDAFALE